ncbi:hypothetical protein V9T40_005713 [Parthenolecanium corni]|uniref:Uncharacterized protein n=1 Tax=Parthenolecanium corni TaxID=536013 RepID=A0AAN9TVJ5_9HEMI
MLLLFYLLSAAISNGLWVSAYTPIIIGQNITIPANETASTPVWQTDSPEPHPSYKITNIGKTAVWASIYYKDLGILQLDDILCKDNCSSNASANVWFNVSEPVYIEPLESTFLSAPVNAIFYFTKLVVVSSPKREDQNGEAVVHVAYGNGEASLDDSYRIKRETRKTTCGGFSKLNSTQIVKKVFKWGGSKIPACFVKTGIDALIELFWPEKKASVWDEVLEQVRFLIDEPTLRTAHSVLTCQISLFKRHLEKLAKKINECNFDTSHYYMYIVEDIIGLEEEIVVRNHHNMTQLNMDLLPLYSNIVLMKAAFYSFGIKFQQKIGLTKQNVANITTYFKDTLHSPVNGANQHIFQTFKNNTLINHYNTEYSREMFARNEINAHGYVPIWDNMLDNPGQKLVINEVYYSLADGSFYGDIIPPPSDPSTSTWLSNRKYNELKKLIIYKSPIINCTDTVVGIILVFENGELSEFGQKSWKYEVVELNSTRRIREIRTCRNKTSDISNFRISLLQLVGNDWKISNEKHIFGCPSSCYLQYHFAKENYYIASIFASFDHTRQLQTPFLNMAVLYLPIKSNVDNTADSQDWREWAY